MNLVEKLLQADVKKAEELEQKTIKSKRLAKILGESDPVEITIQEIPARRMNNLLGEQIDKKGNFDIDKAFDVKALTIVEGLVNPSLKDENMLKHFGCATPKELAIKLFGKEMNMISDEIYNLSSEDNEEMEETIKN
ncbi:phage tail assembly chaperone [Velocimicrobium porci]|uniref:Phage XkdN-like protein n=1 Tax=Velocimicrobium porci TaxID=2606634 RepID=A0A6L5XWR1_9FIRM|nr:hypothetical protein [Velocimicrobium porci]MSS63182.1 hypothetical protein [Velocimicrobium porci]